jgi:pimeloyl-ACP methyl ester carboxylesterase
MMRRGTHLWKRLLALLLSSLLLWIAWDAARPARPIHQAEWLRADDIEVRAVRAGQGDTTLLLLHGYGESLMAWRATFDLLAAHYKVIAIDLPGFALSDKPGAPYDLASYQRRLGDFLARWTSGPVVVVGHSMGGELAAALALDHPDRVVAAVLLAPAGNGLSPIYSDAKGLKTDLRGWVATILSTALPPQDPAWLAEPPDRANYAPASDPAYRAAAIQVLRDFDFTALKDSLALIRQPVLLIWGRQDPTIPFDIGESVAARLPCRRFVPLDHVLHRPHQTNPDTVLSEIETFLAHPGCGS